MTTIIALLFVIVTILTFILYTHFPLLNVHKLQTPNKSEQQIKPSSITLRRSNVIQGGVGFGGMLSISFSVRVLICCFLSRAIAKIIRDEIV